MSLNATPSIPFALRAAKYAQARGGDEAQLMLNLYQNPSVRQAIPRLDSFYLAHLGSSDTLLMLQLLMQQAKMTTDSLVSDSLNKLNNLVFANDKFQQNQQQLNSLYLSFFSTSKPTLDSANLKKLFDIAKQCYITGGPAVFEARAMYWAAVDRVRWSFQDDCLVQTDYFKTNIGDGMDVDSSIMNHKYAAIGVKVYPTLLDKSSILNIESTTAGVLYIFNELGQEVYETPLDSGTWQIDINLNSGCYQYMYKVNSEMISFGKIVVNK
ncbi:MAG: T9SS type A sorting domain-containing protein [Chitinophagales bacterium]